MLDNGSVKFSVSRNGDGFFQHVWLDEDGNGAYWPEEMIVHSAVRGHVFVDLVRQSGKTLRCQGTATSADIRSRKTGDAVVVKGTLGDPGKSGYTLEIEHVPGESAVRVTHALDLRIDPERDRVKAWGLRVPMRYRLGDEYDKRLVSYGCEHGAEEVLVEETRWSYYAHWFIERMHESLKKRNDTGLSQLSQATGFDEHHLPKDQIPWPYWTQSAVVQESPTSYRIWKATAKNVGSLPVYRGKTSSGWVDLYDGRWGMAVALKDMVKRAPAALEVDAEIDSTRGEVTVYFHPRHSAPIDLRPTRKGQSLKERLKETGLSAKRTVVYYFHKGSAEEAKVGEKMGALLR
jgi:hypothetical protein